jgi:WD40 repeat protein
MVPASPPAEEIKTIRLWDVASGHEIGTLTGHRSVVNSLAFGPDGRRLVSGSDDKTVRVWDTSWQPMRGHEDSVGNAEFSRDGRRITSGSKDNTMRMWDTATGRPIGPPMRIDDRDVDSVYPIGQDRLVSVNSDNTVIRLWNARTGKPIGEPVHLPPNILDLRTIAWSDGGDRIAITLALNTVQVWDVETMRESAEPLTHEKMVSTIGFSRDGEVMATGNTDGSFGTIQLWDADTGAPIGEPMGVNGFATAITFSPDGARIAVGETSGSDYRVRIWDTRDFQAFGDPLRVDHAVTVAAFSSDGKILAAGSGDGTIRLWDVGDRTQLGAPLTGHSSGVTSLDFSPDGTKVVSASEDHTLRVWPLPSLSPSPEALCAKITHNMSDEQWDRVVSPVIDYIEVCPNLPEADDAG